MPAKIEPDQVSRIARLARINLTPGELEQFTGQLSDILNYVDQLSELNTDGVEPTTHPLKMSNVFRQDQIGQSLSNAEALANAPQKHGDFLPSPKFLNSPAKL